MRERHLDPTPGYHPLVGRFVTMAIDMGDWNEVELDSLLEERVVVDGSSGETVEVERG